MVVEDRDIGAYQLFDVAQVGAFFGFAEGDGFAVGAGPRGSADPVDVGLGFVRDIVIDDERDSFDVDAACGDVGGDQDPDVAGAELFEGAFAGGLGFVAVDGGGADAVHVEVFDQFVGAVFGAGEDKDETFAVAADCVNEQFVFVSFIDVADVLVDSFGGGGGRCDGDLDRVVEELVGDLHDRSRHGGREKERLTFGRKFGDDAFHVGTTTHVKTDGFREGGGSPDRRTIDDFSIREHLGVLGIRVARQWEKVEPSFSVAWVTRLNGRSFKIVSDDENGVNRWTGEVKSPYTDLLALGLAFDIALPNAWWLRPEARYLQGGDDAQWTVGIGAGLRL